MSGWRPKSTKTTGLPNITFEPQKPANLGTMLKNSLNAKAEFSSFERLFRRQKIKTRRNILASNLVCQKKKVNVHVAEILCQTDGAKIEEVDGLVLMHGLDQFLFCCIDEMQETLLNLFCELRLELLSHVGECFSSSSFDPNTYKCCNLNEI